MALSYSDRYAMLSDKALRQRVVMAIWVTASTFAIGGTDEEKAIAQARLKREANEVELRVAIIAIASTVSDPKLDDEHIQGIVDKIYPSLPAVA